MKKKSSPEQAKYFRFQFTTTVVLLSVVALILCALGIGLSVYRIYADGGLHAFNDWLKYPFFILVCVLGIVVLTALLIKSQYIVDDKNLTTQFGIIKSKCAIKEITSVVLDRDTSKLTVYMGDNFSVLSVRPSWNEDFVRALLKVNPDIEYSYTVKENKPEDKDKKK